VEILIFKDAIQGAAYEVIPERTLVREDLQVSCNAV